MKHVLSIKSIMKLSILVACVFAVGGGNALAAGGELSVTVTIHRNFDKSQ